MDFLGKAKGKPLTGRDARPRGYRTNWRQTMIEPTLCAKAKTCENFESSRRATRVAFGSGSDHGCRQLRQNRRLGSSARSFPPTKPRGAPFFVRSTCSIRYPSQISDDLTQLAVQICQVLIALISLVDQARQWFKAHVGLAASETHAIFLFCATTSPPGWAACCDARKLDRPINSPECGKSDSGPKSSHVAGAKSVSTGYCGVVHRASSDSGSSFAGAVAGACFFWVFVMNGSQNLPMFDWAS